MLELRSMCIFSGSFWKLRASEHAFSSWCGRAMPGSLETKVDVTNERFRANAHRMQKLLADLREHFDRVQRGGGEREVRLHLRRGKLMVRERINLLLDAGSPFLELSQFAGLSVKSERPELACGGLVTGVGLVSGRVCMVFGNDATVKGGSYYGITLKKHLRAQTIAKENNLPCIYLVDSGGANLIEQSSTFPDEHHFGRIFYNQTKMSAMNIPQIAAALGSCTGGAAFIPALADESVMVRQARMYLAGPPLVKAVLGQDVEAEELGGSHICSNLTGTVDHVADNELEALNMVRQAIANSNGKGERRPSSPLPIPQCCECEPLYNMEDLHGLVSSEDLREAFDLREVIARIVDNSVFDEFKSNYGSSMVAGFATLHNMPLAILGAVGPVFPQCAQKASHFVQLCNQRGVPLLFMQNVTGFMIGCQTEASGMAKNAATLMSVVATAQVAKITLVVGGAYGATNYALCGRSMGPRFLFVWPNARVAVMGGSSAADALLHVRREKQRRQGEDFKSDEKEGQKFNQAINDRLENEAEAIFGSSRLWDDGIIEPTKTRQTLAIALHIVRKERQFASKLHNHNLRVMRM